MTVISALAILIGIILIGASMFIRLCEIQLQLDKQKAELNRIISQLKALQGDNEVIDHNLHVIIGSISNLKEELK